MESWSIWLKIPESHSPGETYRVCYLLYLSILTTFTNRNVTVWSDCDNFVLILNIIVYWDRLTYHQWYGITQKVKWISTIGLDFLWYWWLDESLRKVAKRINRWDQTWFRKISSKRYFKNIWLSTIFLRDVFCRCLRIYYCLKKVF